MTSDLTSIEGPEEPAEEAEPLPLVELSDGLTEVIEDQSDLDDYCDALRAGTGPVAIDAERASGYRYGQHAYLIQIRRPGAGTALIDPVPFGGPVPDGPLAALQEAIGDAEWILHAASQDIPCLAEIGMRPTTVFDTELAGRLLNKPRVGLGPMVESELGLRLEKGHGAADWSTRPLPEAWLKYAALDVEVLHDLRETLMEQLEQTGKALWAAEEFAHVAAMEIVHVRPDPWRRTSGIHRIRDRRKLAAVREIWLERDAIARRRDVSPGRILNDAAVIDAAMAMPASSLELQKLPTFKSHGPRRYLAQWQSAIARAASLPESALPPPAPRAEGPPPARSWSDRDPEAFARLEAARAGISALAEDLNLPVENLLSPDLTRRLCWDPPEEITVESVADRLRAGGARPWQVRLASGVLASNIS